jgi:hypothetical protein
MKTASLVLMTIISVGCAASGINSVTYLGHEIKLSRTYSDFHEYRDDEHNLPSEAIEKVAALVRGAPVASSYPSRDAVFHSLFALMFPGYGFSAMNLDKPVALYALEIPQRNEDRYLTFIEREGKWVLIEDFIWPSTGGLLEAAAIIDGQLVYSGPKGNVVREHSL